jgi:hypothetical protein
MTTTMSVVFSPLLAVVANLGFACSLALGKEGQHE